MVFKCNNVSPVIILQTPLCSAALVVVVVILLLLVLFIVLVLVVVVVVLLLLVLLVLFLVLVLLRSPAVSLGFTMSDFWLCDRFFNPAIDVVTFCLR